MARAKSTRRRNRTSNKRTIVIRAPVANRRNINRRKRPRRAGAGKATLVQPGLRVSAVGNALRNVGGIAGAFLGSERLGRAVGGGISRIFGQGDYAIQSNSFLSGGPPAFASLDSGIRIAHREYVADITSSSDFNIKSFQIDPTNIDLFPWLSRVSYNFEEYELKGLVFNFNTTCGNAVSSSNNALGTIGMVTVYDPTDPDLSSKRECEDYVGCVAGVPSNSLLHPIECKVNSNVLGRHYVKNTTVTNLEDLKFYSHGKLNVFTQGMQSAGITLGELWVSYDICFYKPKILPIGTTAISMSWANGTTANQSTGTPFGVSNVFKGPLGLTQDSGGNFTIPRGTAVGWYMLFAQTNYGSSNIVFSVSGISANLVTQPKLVSNTFGQIGYPTSQNYNPIAAGHTIAWVFKKTDTNAGSFTIQSTGPLVGNSQWDMFVTKLSDNAMESLSISDPVLNNVPRSRLLKMIEEALPQLLDNENRRRLLEMDPPPTLLARRLASSKAKEEKKVVQPPSFDEVE